jgi:hypothetical protein
MLGIDPCDSGTISFVDLQYFLYDMHITDCSDAAVFLSFFRKLLRLPQNRALPLPSTSFPFINYNHPTVRNRNYSVSLLLPVLWDAVSASKVMNCGMRNVAIITNNDFEVSGSGLF